MSKHVSGSSARTLRTIFQHPISHNLEWREVRSAFQELGDVTEEHNGNLKIDVNGHTLILAQSHGKDVANSDDVMKLRHFLKEAGHEQSADESPSNDLLIVIDHKEALIYKMESSAEAPERIVPHDPHGLGRHVHSGQTDISIHEKANRKSFYEGIAKTVGEAGNIVVLGDGKGSSSEMTLFIQELQEHHPKIAERIVGTSTVDLHHLTEGELLATARECFGKVPLHIA